MRLRHSILIAVMLMACTAFAQTTSITIGSFEYQGTTLTTINGANPLATSYFDISLNASGITVEPITFSNVIMYIKGASQGTKANGLKQITTGPGCGQSGITSPCEFAWLGANAKGYIFPPCANNTLTVQMCPVMMLQLISPNSQNFSFSLADGEIFCTYGVTNIVLSPEPNQTELNPQCANNWCVGTSVPIVLQAAPAGSCTAAAVSATEHNEHRKYQSMLIVGK